MIKNQDFMKELTEIVSCDNRLRANDFFAFEPDVSDGSSYDGFINFTDGFIDCKAEFTPKWQSVNVYGGKNKAQQKRSRNVQKILDNFNAHNFNDFFDYYLSEDEDFSEFKDEFETVEDFKNWFEKYVPYEKDTTPNLFTGKCDLPKDMKHDRLYEKFLEVDNNEYNETPAFLGVCLKLYDEDNRNGGHKRMARLESYINDDLSYGREHVGSWARLMGMTSADGSDLGNHYVFLSEFQYTTLNDLKKKLKPRVQKAYDSLGL